MVTCPRAVAATAVTFSHAAVAEDGTPPSPATRTVSAAPLLSAPRVGTTAVLPRVSSHRTNCRGWYSRPPGAKAPMTSTDRSVLAVVCTHSVAPAAAMAVPVVVRPLSNCTWRPDGRVPHA